MSPVSIVNVSYIRNGIYSSIISDNTNGNTNGKNDSKKTHMDETTISFKKFRYLSMSNAINSIFSDPKYISAQIQLSSRTK